MTKLKVLSEKKLWLAPLAGLTDSPFRLVCKKQGADVSVSEMVSSDGLVFDYQRSIPYAQFSERERPFGIQLFGSRPEIMASACRLLIPLYPDFIDINMGCPVKKVVKRGAGSALLKDIPLAVKIVTEMKRELEGTGILLTAKIRAGWDKGSIIAVEFAQALEEAGVEILIIHPRTRVQLYSGRSDWSLISAVKSAVKVPVIGNGDVTSVHEAIRMFSETGCDSIMIGRGALGNPWIFAEIKSYLLTGAVLELSYKEKYKTIKEHTDLALCCKEEHRALKELRVHFCHYTKGFEGGRRVRDLINRSISKEDIIREIGVLYEGSS